MKNDNFDNIVNAMVEAYNNSDNKETKEESYNDYTVSAIDEINTKLDRISNDVHYIASLFKTSMIVLVISFVIAIIAFVFA